MRRVFTKMSVVRCACDQRREPIVVLLPDLGRHDRIELGAGHLDAEIQPPRMALVHDRAGTAVAAGEPARDVGDRLLGRRQTQPQERAVGDMLQALERERQVRPAPGANHRVDLVDDDGPDGAQHEAAALRRQQEVERLRRGDQDVRRRSEHRRPIGRRRVTGADGGGDVRRVEARRARHRPDAPARFGEVLVDVRAERLQRRHVEDAHLVWQGSLQTLLQQLVDGRQERRERLARAGRRGDQGVMAVANGRPAAALRRRWLAKGFCEPLLDNGMKSRSHHDEDAGCEHRHFSAPSVQRGWHGRVPPMRVRGDGSEVSRDLGDEVQVQDPARRHRGASPRLLRQICVAREVTIIRGAVSPDHIHMLLAAPPQLAPSKLVQFLKGRSSRLLQQEFPALRKRYCGQHLWARGYTARAWARWTNRRSSSISRTSSATGPRWVENSAPSEP